jgi:hypothetical protein
MSTRILPFPAPRTPLFRRRGPFRFMAFLMLAMISAGLLALLLGFGSPAGPSDECDSSRTPPTPAQ